MNINPYLSRFSEMVSFWGRTSAPNIEVALHDLSNPRQSIISIHNGHVTGRKVGDGFRDPEIEKINDMLSTGRRSALNFKGTVGTEPILHTSVMILFNDGGQPIGAVTVNADITVFIAQANSYGVLLYIPDDVDSSAKSQEPSNPELTPADMIERTLTDIFGSAEKRPSSLTPYEKIKIVEQLQAKNMFSMKGAVSEVARYLSISESSVYRYLKQLNKQYGYSPM